MSGSNKQIRGIRQSIPAGSVLGRKSPGTGAVEVLTNTDIALAVVNSGQVVTTGGTNPQQWTAGYVTTLGTEGLFIDHGNPFIQGAANGTLATYWQVGTVVATLGTNISINSGTLEVAQEWLAGTVTALGTNISINSGTINVAQEWNAGSVTAIASSLTISGETLGVVSAPQEWQAGTVTTLGTNISINSGTLNFSQEWLAGSITSLGTGLTDIGGTLNAVNQLLMSGQSLLGNSGSATATATNIAVGTGLTLALGTLSSTGGGSTTTVVAGSNLTGGTITTSGTVALANAITLTSGTLTGLASPVAATDAVNKTYVDSVVAALNPAIAVQAATTTSSDTSGFTYNNGVSGVGATFTGATNTAVVIDGFTFTTPGQRLLVKNDTQSPSGAFNGIYYVTQLQTSLLPPVLTRALDYDQPSDMNNTGAIPVVSGTVNAGTSWLLTSTVATVGTSPLTYSQFSLSVANSWNAGTVSTVGPSLAINSGTINLSTIAASSLFGNAATVGAIPGAIVVGANLTLTSGGTLNASAGGGGGSGIGTLVAGSISGSASVEAIPNLPLINATSANPNFTTWLNQGSVTETLHTNGPLSQTITPSNTTQVHVHYKAVPAGAFTLVANLGQAGQGNSSTTTNCPGAGLALTNGTKVAALDFGFQRGTFFAATNLWSNTTTNAGGIGSPTFINMVATNPLWGKIAFDGTTSYAMSISVDGFSFIPVNTLTASQITFTPTGIGLSLEEFTGNAGSGPYVTSLNYWNGV